jgi:hypothetical protein
MYAKLVFPYSSTPMQRNRDIARIIHESSSGSASLSNLEFINQESSEFFAGVNSGWSLASGSIPAKGVALSTSVDNSFTLQSPCVDTNKIKYANITINGINTNTTLLNSNGVPNIIQPVIDYGTATETKIGGYSATASSIYPYYGFGRLGGAVYIFATPRKLIIGGTTVYRFHLYMHLEFAETGQTQLHNLVPQAYMCYTTAGTADGQEALQPYYGGNRYGSGFDQGFAFFTFLKSIYSTEHSTIARFLHGGVDTAFSDFTDYIYLENGTTTGLATAPATDLAYELRWRPAILFPPWLLYTSNPGTGGRTAQQTKPGGGITFPLFPLYTSIDRWNTGIISFKDCNVYSSVSDIGVMGDTVKVGNNDYILFAEPGKPSTLIRKE